MQLLRALTLVSALFCVACVAGALRNPSAALAAEPKSAISLQEIRDRGVEGRLGFRLGMILEVSGEVVANTSTAKSDAGEPFLLKITTVNGKSLRAAVLYPFAKQNPALTLAPQIGDRFSYMAFETGRFQGAPDGEYRYVPAYATNGFGFSTALVVLAAK